MNLERVVVVGVGFIAAAIRVLGNAAPEQWVVRVFGALRFLACCAALLFAEGVWSLAAFIGGIGGQLHVVVVAQAVVVRFEIALGAGGGGHGGGCDRGHGGGCDRRHCR